MAHLRFNSAEHMLCGWCRENVFDKHTIALLDRDNPTMASDMAESRIPAPFQEGVDGMAYFTNRASSRIYNRNFSQNSRSVKQQADKGCVFCFLFEEALCQIAASDVSLSETIDPAHRMKDRLKASGDAGIDFSLTMVLKPAWEWSGIAIRSREGDDAAGEFFFRLYPVDRHFMSGGLASSLVTPSYKRHMPDQGSLDHDAPPAAVTESQNDPKCKQTLESYCVALRALLDDCVANHAACSSQREVSLLPSMLLQISGTASSPSVRLVKTSDILVRPVRYICLSYCWGGPQPGNTTTSRVGSYLAGIDISLFPRTILDAIRVTLGVGFEYLWVDAMCIVQDSGHEKNIELNKMSSIYAGAACTICVLSAKTASEGFLEPSQDTGNDQPTTRHVELRDAKGDHAAVLEVRSDLSAPHLWDEHLLTRAWTYQEALLSPRIIMFFSEDQRPAFRCSMGTRRSDGGIVSSIPKPMMRLEETMVTLKNTWEPWIISIENEWSTIVKQFTQRSVTFVEDTFPALLGIVTEWGSRLDAGTYQAGLWSSTMRCDLMWRAQKRYKPRSAHKSYIAPSWSWASRAHPVYYQDRGDLTALEHIARVISCDITPVNPEVPNGALRSARLIVECIAEPVTFPSAPEDTEVTIGNGDVIDMGNEIETSDGCVRFHFDDDPKPRDLGEIWLLSLAEEEPYNNPHEVGLGVKEVENPDGDGVKLYVRVGMFDDMRRGKEPRGPMRQFTII